MPDKVRVILITDGDENARQVLEMLAGMLNLRCLSASAGNPTPVSGEKIVALLKQTPYDPVLVMFDDRGNPGKGKGETALEYVARHPDVTVLGAIAVASKNSAGSAAADACIDNRGETVPFAVDKDGQPLACREGAVIGGDTVAILNSLSIPVVIGLGDIGKMNRADDVHSGAPVTYRAIREILKRSGVINERRTEDRQRH